MRGLLYVLFACVSAVLVLIIVGPNEVQISGHEKPLQITRLVAIRTALLNYANRHDGKFPVGRSSTEVFQGLVDDGDAVPSFFFFELEGKSMAYGAKLEAENVCYDFTGGSNANVPSWLPLVIATGYRIDYQTGKAERLQSFAIRDDRVNVAYIDHTQYFDILTKRLWLYPQTTIDIMPNKPASADVSGYHQLTPK